MKKIHALIIAVFVIVVSMFVCNHFVSVFKINQSRDSAITPPQAESRVLLPVKPSIIPTVNNDDLSIPTQNILTPTIPITPSPTLQVLSSNQKIDGNDNCNLPCWYGIIPGLTTWEDAKRNLENGATLSLLDSRENYLRDDGKIISYSNYAVHLNAQNSTQVFRIGEIDGIVSHIYVGSPTTDEKYTLAKLIKESGKPSQVLLLTKTHGMNFPLPFSLLLSYKEKNFVALFTSLHKENYENIKSCFKEGAYLQIFNTGDHITDEYLIDRLSGNESSVVLDTEEALGMSLQEFYEYYRDNSTNCVTTPASIWP